ASMPEVMRFIGTGDPWPPLLAEDVARAERRHWEDHGFGWRATIDKADGRGIGLVSLNYAGEGTAGPNPEEREIGWGLGPRARRGGGGSVQRAPRRSATRPSTCSRCRASSPGSNRATTPRSGSPAHWGWSSTSRRPAAAASGSSSTGWTAPRFSIPRRSGRRD